MHALACSLLLNLYRDTVISREYQRWELWVILGIAVIGSLVWIYNFRKRRYGQKNDQHSGQTKVCVKNKGDQYENTSRLPQISGHVLELQTRAEIYLEKSHAASAGAFDGRGPAA